MIEFDKNDRTKRIHIKSGSTHLHYAWITAVWDSGLTEFLNEYVLDHKNMLDRIKISNGKKNTDEFEEGNYIDIGNSEDFQKITEKGWI